MESKKPASKRLTAVAAGGVAVVALVAGIFFFTQRDEENITDGDTPRIGYAADATLANDANELQRIADETARDKGVTLEYSNSAVSLDGKTVTCYVANAAENQYDMYFGVYFDPDCTDELYLSQLLRPGTALREITLSRTLQPGNYQVYVVETQVGDIDGVQTIMNQVSHTVELQVKE